MKRSIVLLSGGLDSSVNLHQAHQETEVVLALTFDYGQRAAKKEIQSAHRQCIELGINHQVLNLSWLGGLGSSALTHKDQKVPTTEVEIDDLEQSEKTAKSVWVPNRNGVFLNIAAAFAESLMADTVVPGFNIEEAATFPDNSKDFLTALDRSFFFSTANQVQAICFTTDLNKTQIVQRGRELGVNFDLLWPCYLDQDKICGKCESCQRYLRALNGGGLP